MQSFDGAKLALFIGPMILTSLRDDIPGIPWPGRWDLPGGGREGTESPAACARREAWEEFGLRVPARALRAPLRHADSPVRGQNWFFAAHLPRSAAGRIRFGDEGQGWCLMAPRDFIRHPKGIPHLQALLALYLRAD